MTLRPDERLDRIEAENDKVVFVDKAGRRIGMSIEEAFNRAMGIRGLDESSRELINQLVYAADLAAKYVQKREGRPVTGLNKRYKDMVFETAKEQDAERRQQ